jgi:hypothetical protein
MAREPVRLLVQFPGTRERRGREAIPWGGFAMAFPVNHLGLCGVFFGLLFHAGLPTAPGSELAVVGFDTPAIVVAEPVNPAVVQAPTTGGKLVRLRIPVSTFLSPEFSGTVSEYLVEIECPQQSMRVIDFWPKAEFYTEVAGTIAVDSQQQKDSHVAFKVSGGYEPFVRGAANGEFNSKSATHERYQRKPPMQMLTAAGTVRRGYGVFYKFRPGPLPQLEGEREVAILLEVPSHWRADLLQVSMRAVGTTGASSRPQTLGQSRLWMTVHMEGDQGAAAQAQHYVAQERALRARAAENQKQIANKSLPTLWHKMGAAIDVVDPKIPNDYLVRILFGTAPQNLRKPHFDEATSRLPVDLRVAVLDYWEQREAILNMAHSTSSTTSLVVN